jgi:hypothetical protein
MKRLCDEMESSVVLRTSMENISLGRARTAGYMVLHSSK